MATSKRYVIECSDCGHRDDMGLRARYVCMRPGVVNGTGSEAACTSDPSYKRASAQYSSDQS